MATISWPSALQQYVDTDSFQYKIGETVTRSTTDIGPAKVRRLTTRPVDSFDAGILLKKVEDFYALQTFYNTTTAGGSLRFNFPHPITRQTVECRFTGPPNFAPLGGYVFKAAFTLEIMP